ncbi:hypothetical protein [Bacillus sp. S10(2024)]|uniref:hypothetical protein n=1 Tax=Bacillus sp. S10(2024) TaxID=3162886 RepID=UPI003D1C65A9
MSAKHFNSYGHPAPPPNYPRESAVFTTGPVWRNPNTEVVIVTLLNEDYNIPQTVTVSVLDWQNTYNPAEVSKSAFLYGQVVNPPVNTAQTIQPQQNSIVPPGNIQPILTPFTFTIPPRNLLVIHASLPNPFQMPSPCYEVLVTSQHGPAKCVITNTFGVNAAGVPQEGNTALHHQFSSTPAISHGLPHYPYAPLSPVAP